jgi:hypothetical protein
VIGACTNNAISTADTTTQNVPTAASSRPKPNSGLPARHQAPTAWRSAGRSPAASRRDSS